MGSSGGNSPGRDLETLARAGKEAALEAGRILMEHLRAGFDVALKGEIDLVTEIDLKAERHIVSRLLTACPGARMLAEETRNDTVPGAVTWILDPLDGTTNYAHGYPVFSVSLALEIEGTVEWGIVYNPNLEEVFTARRGGGAFLNGTPLRVSTEASLGSSLLATGFPYDIRTSRRNNLSNFCEFALRARGIRRGGSAALDLCYVAAGRFDGYWELKLHPWDCAAGYLMVREAGGRVTNWRGEEGSIYEGECLATNACIHGQMLAVLEAVNAGEQGIE